jgi:ABC-type polysaccharide/polyol phosphate transport system ATPase subunit
MRRIEVRGVRLKFNVHFHDQRMTLRRLLIQTFHRPAAPTHSPGADSLWGSASTFWALDGISFDVEDGEAVGLVGPNGAGKSTLLMVLAGIYHPNAGHARVEGQVGTLLALGAGFDPELTGQENIQLYGTFMGWSPEAIAERTAHIVEFADLDRFIHAPLKTYSSGMRARLGFSLAIHMDPDVLLLDEVLAAGDAAFQEKAGNLIARYREQGKTIIFASHSLETIRKQCPRSLLLERGKLIADAPTDEVLEIYRTRRSPK